MASSTWAAAWRLGWAGLVGRCAVVQGFPVSGGDHQPLRLAVPPFPAQLPRRRSDDVDARPVAAQLVGDQHPGHVGQAREQLAKEPGRGLGVTPGRDQNVQDDAVVVDHPPQVVGLSVDLNEHLVQVPRAAWAGPLREAPRRPSG